MREYLVIAIGVIGFFVVVIGLTAMGMDYAINQARKNQQLSPIIVHCPENTKQIVIPDAKKLEL